MATVGRTFRNVVLTASLLGLAGIALSVLLPFEEPDHALLVLSSALVFTPIASVFAHVKLTGALTRGQRRMWLRQLTGRKAVWALGDYLTCEDLGSAADRFGSESNDR
jgi:hypothetical protein